MVNGAGNVGIGNEWPAAKLDVNGDARISGTVILGQAQGDISMGVFQ